MGVSKVNLGEETLVDLTEDTVNPNNLLKGATAHGADGEPVEGAVTYAPLTTSLAVTEEGVAALDGTVGKALNDKGAQVSVYKGDDGNLHFRDWNGADTVIPFSSGKIKRTTIYSGNSRNSQTIDVKQYDGYKNFTLDNFALENAAILYLRDNVNNSNNNILSKYDAENGLLYLSSSVYTPSTNAAYCVSYSVVLIT